MKWELAYGMELELDWDLTDFGFCCDALEVADEGVGVEMDSVVLCPLLFSLAEATEATVAAAAEVGVVATVEAEATDEAGDDIVSCWLEDMLGCWLLASTWTTDELLSLSSSAVTSSLELEVAEAVTAAESLRLEIFILAVPLTTSMNLQE